jgi:hypothetical protein
MLMTSATQPAARRRGISQLEMAAILDSAMVAATSRHHSLPQRTWHKFAGFKSKQK